MVLDEGSPRPGVKGGRSPATPPLPALPRSHAAALRAYADPFEKTEALTGRLDDDEKQIRQIAGFFRSRCRHRQRVRSMLRVSREQQTRCQADVTQVACISSNLNNEPLENRAVPNRNPKATPAAHQRRVLITGVTRGLGRAMAEEFARLGHIVIGCGRSAKAIVELASSLGAPHRFDVVDVTDDGQVHAWATEEISSHGAPDLLVNNAALVNRNAPLWKISAQEFDAVIDVNIKGVANVIRHFVPAMVKAGQGVIVNFSSGWGRSTNAEVAPYCATKWAMEGLTRALAQELPKGMAAVPLNPGIIDTDMLRSSFGDAAGSYPSPQQWAKLAVPFLLRIGPRDNGKPLTVG